MSIVGGVTAKLRIVLDQLVTPSEPDLAVTSRSLSQALVETAPSGCEVAGIMPAVRGSEEGGSDLPDLADVWRATVAQRELAQAWRWGMPLGAAQGMIHSPTLMAPLVRHDRVHNHDQTVVTLWSLEAWTAPGRLARGAAAWQRAMLARAVRYADAVVVPTHAMAAQLADIAPLGARIRVIAGAPGTGFGVPGDASQRVVRAGVSAPYIVALASVFDSDELDPVFAGAAALDLDVVVIGAGRGEAPHIVDRAQASGLAERRVHTIVDAEAADRAALLVSATAVVAVSTEPVYPWRLLETLVVGAPVIAVATPQHHEVLAEAALFTAPGDRASISEALVNAIEDENVARRLRVLAADRSRAFTWSDAAQRVWQLHAEL